LIARLRNTKVSLLEKAIKTVLPSKPELNEEPAPEVVRTKRFTMKPMTVEDAVIQMELLGHNFFLFYNSATKEYNLLYRRKDGIIA